MLGNRGSTHGREPRATQVVERAGGNEHEHGVEADRPDEIDENCILVEARGVQVVNGLTSAVGGSGEGEEREE